MYKAPQTQVVVKAPAVKGVAPVVPTSLVARPGK